MATALVYDMDGHLSSLSLQLRQPVFIKGELLVLDSERGRECNGQGRNPSKWDVAVRTFALDQYEAAIAYAKAVTNGEQHEREEGIRR